VQGNRQVKQPNHRNSDSISDNIMADLRIRDADQSAHATQLQLAGSHAYPNSAVPGM